MLFYEQRFSVTNEQIAVFNYSRVSIAELIFMDETKFPNEKLHRSAPIETAVQ